MTTPLHDKKYELLSIVFWLVNKMRLTVQSSDELTMNCSHLFWLVNKLFLIVQSSDMTCSDLWTSCDLLYSPLIWLVLSCEQAGSYCTVPWGTGHDLFETYCTVLWWTGYDVVIERVELDIQYHPSMSTHMGSFWIHPPTLQNKNSVFHHTNQYQLKDQIVKISDYYEYWINKYYVIKYLGILFNM